MTHLGTVVSTAKQTTGQFVEQQNKLQASLWLTSKFLLLFLARSTVHFQFLHARKQSVHYIVKHICTNNIKRLFMEKDGGTKYFM